MRLTVQRRTSVRALDDNFCLNEIDVIRIMINLIVIRYSICLIANALKCCCDKLYCHTGGIHEQSLESTPSRPQDESTLRPVNF